MELNSFRFTLLNSEIQIRSNSAAALKLIKQVWPATPKVDSALGSSLKAFRQCYTLYQNPDDACADQAHAEQAYTLRRVDEAGTTLESFTGLRAEQLLFHLDKAILMQLQRDYPELYFLHGAVLATAKQGILLTGSSGAGKSSLALALSAPADTPWQLLSDELAPLNPVDQLVYPYWRAIGLKQKPPAPLTLPAGSLEISNRFHIPVSALRHNNPPRPRRLDAVFSIAGQFDQRYAAGEMLSTADSAMILLRNVLNSLAHDGGGMAAAIALAAKIPCFNIPRMPILEARQMIQQITQSHCG